MFDWFFKKSKDKDERSRFIDVFFEKPTDDIESALWEIKDLGIYDLPTEEVTEMVQSKRKNINYLHEQIKKPKT